MRVIGICGSARKDGNTEKALAEALKEVEKQGIETELITLADKKIEHCKHCNSCKDGPCPTKDDVLEIMDKMKQSDGIIMASPTYFADVSSRLKTLFDRTLLLRRQGMQLKNKVCGAIVTGASRNGGQEFVCATILRWGLLQEMIIIADTETAHFGGIGLGGSSDLDRILEDEEGLRTIRNLGKRVAEVVKMVRK